MRIKDNSFEILKEHYGNDIEITNNIAITLKPNAEEKAYSTNFDVKIPTETIRDLYLTTDSNKKGYIIARILSDCFDYVLVSVHEENYININLILESELYRMTDMLDGILDKHINMYTDAYEGLTDLVKYLIELKNDANFVNEKYANKSNTKLGKYCENIFNNITYFISQLNAYVETESMDLYKLIESEFTKLIKE